MSDLLKAGGCGERRLGLACAHGVTRGANIKRELTPLLKIANVLCLGCRNHAKDAADCRDDQRSRAHGSVLNHMTECSRKIQRYPRAADHTSEAPFSNGAPGRRPGAGFTRFALRGKIRPDRAA